MADRKPLGGTGLHISPIVLGGGVFGVNGMGRSRSFAVLDAYVERGGTTLDTADIYSAHIPGAQGGESESVIGAWIAQRGRRDDLQIVTKVGGPFGAVPGRLTADYIERSIEGSLRRLRTDYVDVYLAHVDDPAAPQEETAEAFDRLVRAGKVRAIGASNFRPSRLKSALAIAQTHGFRPYQVFQPAYNLMERGFERVYRQFCADNAIGVVTYFGLAQGYLSGKYRSEQDLSKSLRGGELPAFGGQVRSYVEGRGPVVLAAMDRIAAERGVNLAAIALAWIMTKPGVAAPIASATGLAQLDQLMQAVDLDLSVEEMAWLDAASAETAEDLIDG